MSRCPVGFSYAAPAAQNGVSIEAAWAEVPPPPANSGRLHLADSSCSLLVAMRRQRHHARGSAARVAAEARSEAQVSRRRR